MSYTHTPEPFVKPDTGSHSEIKVTIQQTRFIQAILCKIQGLFKDFFKTFLLFPRTET